MCATAAMPRLARTPAEPSEQLPLWIAVLLTAAGLLLVAAAVSLDLDAVRVRPAAVVLTQGPSQGGQRTLPAAGETP